ncbi:hypothetical protein CALCODRAFT_255663 [Calocera cornea HHB12733]|uniref:Uncharacterized protein n=1 Tax=Calocera cornea HHB12733 TaxID=1353952 RepID=A0A165GJ73_9BASI|nr:hypothetical protein CALCODRAFT_255663 [Calocera cornea HHB12733]
MTSADVLPRAVDLLAAHTSLLSKVRQTQQLNHSLLSSAFPEQSRPAAVTAVLQAPLTDASHTQVPILSSPASPPPPKRPLPDRPDLPPAKRARMAKYRNYVPEEETVRNDYSQHYVDTGDWPQNYVQGAELERRFEECVRCLSQHQHMLILIQVSQATPSVAAEEGCGG